MSLSPGAIIIGWSVIDRSMTLGLEHEYRFFFVSPGREPRCFKGTILLLIRHGVGVTSRVLSHLYIHERRKLLCEKLDFDVDKTR